MHKNNVVKQFESQVQNTPELVAIIDGDQKMSYKALNEKANQIAEYLKTQDVQPGDFVAILLEPSIDFMLCMLASIKIGAVYLPLDNAIPQKRLNKMIADANPKIIITNSLLKTQVHNGHQIRDIKQVRMECIPFSINNVSCDSLLPNAPVYMMYTSGSTGEPKGVIITHQAVVNLCHTDNYAKVKKLETVSQFSNLAFDGATFEIWSALLNGATLLIIPASIRLNQSDLQIYLKNNVIDCLFLPTSYFHQLIKSSPETLDTVKKIMFGGEQVNFSLLKAFLKYRKDNKIPITLLNAYGPTEATTCTCRHVMTEQTHLTDEELMSIGATFENVKTYILDEQMQPSNEGELYISGINLALGYYNCDIQNKEKFLKNPFTNKEPYQRIYKTGDKARLLPSGHILCLGRLDDQVKIGGFRIHLNEIEQKLMAYPNIAMSAVIVEIGGGQHKMLTAYIVLADKSQAIHADDIRSVLAESLPSYMLPSKYVMIDAFPLTAVGKIDKKKLDQTPHTDLSFHFDAATSHPIEKEIQTIWCHLLNRSVVDVHKNFFDLGANSLLITESCALINKALGAELKIADIQAHPTIYKLTRYLEGDIDIQAAKKTKLTSSPDIAIIGMSCRFPNANSLNTFWENIYNQVDCLTRFPVTDDAVEEEKNIPVRGILSDIELFDASFFGFNPVDASITDPQQRLFLEVAWEALEHAGASQQKSAEKIIGVFAGMTDSTYLQENLLKNNWFLKEYDHFQQRITNSIGMLSTQLSYRLNLKGRSVNVSTACSTGLIAVDEACQDLITGDSDIALAGAVSIVVPQQKGYHYQEGSILSPTGKCMPFSDQANGTVFSNGVGVVILKRLEDAIAEGDTIYAVIKGRGVNNDGSDKLGYTAPSHSGQVKCILSALEDSKLEAKDIHYIETHGTATRLGDIVEFSALKDAFQSHTKQKQFCALGAVKSNIGHTDVAAGIAGLIKTALCLYHKHIPPMTYYANPNPELDIDNSPFFINKEPIIWNQEAPLHYAGISAFGVGGTNAHMILSEYRAPEKKNPKKAKTFDQLLILSAKSQQALEEMTENLLNHLSQTAHQNPDFLAQTAFTLQTGREDLAYRRYAVGCNFDAIKAAFSKSMIQNSDKNTDTNIVFMFPGQGTQYPQMAKELMQITYFAKLVHQGAKMVSKYLDCDLISLLEAENPEQLNETQYAQPAIFIIEYALAKLLIYYGIQPHALIGHSLGEYVAACLADVFSFEDGVALVCERGMLMAKAPRGAMLGITCSSEDFQVFQKEVNGIELALHNSNQHCVASGTIEQIALLEKYLQKNHIEYQKLNVSHAFHSHLMESTQHDFIDMLSNISLSTPKIPIISNLTGDWLSPQEAMDPQYWYQHMRNTVRLKDGLEVLAKDSHSFFIEVGPKRSLCYFLTSILSTHSNHGHTISHALSPAHDFKQVLEVLGRAWMKSIHIHWSLLHHHTEQHKIPLPTYPFQRQRYWVEADRELRTNKIHYFQPAWVGQKIYHDPRFLDKKGLKDKTWVVIKDRFDLANQFISFLKKHHVEPMVIDYDEFYLQEQITIFKINPNEKNDYFKLVKEIKDHNNLVFLDLSSYGLKTEISSPTTSIYEQLKYSFYHLLYLSQALIGNAHSLSQIKIGMITSGTQQLASADELNPFNATLTGAGHVITQENPFLKFKIFDLSMETEVSEKVIYSVIEKCTQNWDESFQIEAYRQDHLWHLHYNEIKSSQNTVSRLRDHGVYFITGGLGGIALSCCEIITKTVAKPIFILIGRSAMSPKVEWEIISNNPNHPDHEQVNRLIELENLGATLHLYQIDITQADALNTLVQQCIKKLGKINGLIHTAGIAISAPTQSKTTDSAEAVFAPKITGTLNLIQAFKTIPLDFVVLKSSLSAILGGFGQVDYAAANAFLDTISKTELFSTAKFIVSINWNTWREVGIAARNQKEGKINFIGKGDDISPKEGKKIFLDLLQGRVSSVAVSRNNINEVQETRFNATIEPPSISRDELPIDAKNYIPPSSKLESQLVELWQQSLGIDKIGIDDDFFSLGGHSLQAINLIEKINKALKCNLPMTQFYTTPTIKALSVIIDDSVEKEISIIVPLKNINKNLPCLFLCHPISGLINCFDSFVKQSELDISLYGLQDPSILTKTMRYTSISAMVDDYLLSIKKIQPTGPYYLLGYSFGGVIAYELVNKLKQEGKEIKFLGLIDSWAVNPQPLQNANRFKQYLKTDYPELSETLIDLAWEREKLLLNHRLSQTKQDMVLFRATDEQQEFKQVQTMKNGWEDYNSGEIVCHYIQGTHQSILEHSNITNVLYLLNKIINDHSQNDISK